jgi:hypothetical protein
MRKKSKLRTEGVGVTKITGRVVGGTAAVTRTKGKGFTVAYVSTGRYRITYAEAYYEQIAVSHGLMATTPGDIAGHTVVFGVLSGRVQDVYLYNASDALHDLAALEWISFEATFRAGTVDAN